MKKLGLVAASLSFLAVSCGYAAAQSRDDPRFDGGRPPPPMNDHRDDHGGDHSDGRRDDHHDWQSENHHDWQRGERVGHDDWDRAGRVDYRARHLRRPPRGYEWREVDGRFILAAVATGVIADIILNAR